MLNTYLIFKIANKLGLQTEQGQKCLMITNVLGLQTTQDHKCLKVTNVLDLQTSQGYKVQDDKILEMWLVSLV